ncbi:general transcription factor 3C polypeptide 5, putative [Plasmodium berghei]|uniref:General transcription factor 3C polypeptide 5, putative n=2 Tax=Plasmodium berghei TaxID=5821 RepID=A0A509AHB1_PLABA|nr:general transcription factor 3C polypeptide 5, putative [Plasmodium berghei ANKA]CXI17205.1 general transcription factor 3C polypeptide 5, putative [Plasmodium berghei]SCM19684.1 general transcription factor 3C polypeptide 5, putative [Plasmodium berghei]SCN23428.1 general transcription factor 3C polypeptide 5, putative [Plasmodium berghei]SCO59077.1 general transcription factor 3C polypeptide 5, putative [Plasmodium berghei]SCO59711.1 general transcription factor 3C polypeptide 5, putative|eukprot:XP_034420590.1 general transcription factor 3C polypeptide 5, putative [Plasmodium berghei ANKA]
MYREYDFKNEDNKRFINVKRKKDRNKNINFEQIKKNNYICVEIPGKIKKRSNGLSAVESLGGLNKITELFKYDENIYNKNGYENEGHSLILRINNNDIFSSFVSSNCTKVNNILIKIKKTKKNRYKIEFIGFVKYLYYFDNMSDFYYIPTFYNRHNYSTNYIHYLTKDEKEKSTKSKDNKNENENNKRIFPDSYFDHFFPNNFNLNTECKNKDFFPNQINGTHYPWNNSICLNKNKNIQNIENNYYINEGMCVSDNANLNNIQNINQTINETFKPVNNNGEKIDTIFENPILTNVKENSIVDSLPLNSSTFIFYPNQLSSFHCSTFAGFDKNNELDKYFSDKEKKELYKNILNYKDALNMFDDKTDFNFSSEESEGYELQSCIHSKSTIPYDFKKYKSQKISKYIREYKYIISKFTEPFDSKNEIKNEDLENFIKKLIINKNEKEHDLPNKSVSLRFASENIENEKDLENKNSDKIEMEKNDKLNIENNILYNNKYMDQNISNGSSDSIEIRKEAKENYNRNNSSDDMNKIIVSKKTVHCNPIANFNDPVYPIIPYESALKKYVSVELYNRVKCLFDIRPIWSKEVLVEHLENVTTYCLKSCFSKICFYFANGPWRRTYCRYGYDPRNDPSSYIYQTIDFRDNYYRDINTKNIEEMNKPIIKKKNILDQTITNIIKNINEGDTKFSNISDNNYFYINKENVIKIKRENFTNSDLNIYGNEIPNMVTHSESNLIQDNFKTSVNTDNNNIKLNTTKNIEPNNSTLHIKISHEEDEEINEIFKFLKRSNSFHFRKKFSSEIHFCVSPLKLSTIYQYIDIFDNNVLNYLSSIKTQDVCTKDNGWISNKDITKIRDILFVKSMTLRQAHTK